jgi:protein-L-isoaspartate(D-aspartate) O-methyltransferase
VTDGTIATARRWFAEELRHTAHVCSESVIEAFATVPREHFAGPGPWRILSPMHLAEYWTTEDADPRHLYHDVLIAIDEERGLNNGQPSLWAFLYDQLNLAPGPTWSMSVWAPAITAQFWPKSSDPRAR